MVTLVKGLYIGPPAGLFLDKFGSRVTALLAGAIVFV
jgi:hypothetical protein